MTRVSALIPTYNREGYVGGAIETVLGQTYADVEAVVVDDASTDGTRDVLRSYSDDDRVRVLHNEENRGVASTFNRAAEAAEGDLFCILGDDDRWHPEKVERQVQVMDAHSSDVGVVYTGGVGVREGRVIQVAQPSWRGNIYPDVLGTFGVAPHSGHMIRREAFEAVDGFDTSFPRGVDWDMTIRLAKRYRFEYVPAILVERHLHDDNLSGQSEQRELYGMVLDKYADEFRRHPDAWRTIYAQWYYRMRGASAIQDGRHREAVRHYAAAFRCTPSVSLALSLVVAALGPRAFDLAGRVRRRSVDAKVRASEEYPWPGASA